MLQIAVPVSSLTLALFLALVLVPATASGAGVYPPNRAALVGIFRAFGGPEGRWRDASEWTDTDRNADPCSDTRPWKGVTCSESGYVVELRLPDNGLRARSPSAWRDGWTHIGRLERAVVIDLSGNPLAGDAPAQTIPDDSLVRLTRLRELDLSRAGLAGYLPDADLEGMSAALERLNMSRNALRGPLTDGLWAATALRVLDLSHNDLQGRIPAAIQELAQLESLDLSGNRLGPAVPRTLCRLRRLRQVVLARNELRLCPDLAACTALVEIDLSHNHLAGEPPAFFLGSAPGAGSGAGPGAGPGAGYGAGSGASPLERVDLSHNELSGPAPIAVLAAPALRALGLAGNLLTSRLPEAEYAAARARGVKITLAQNPLDCPLPAWARDEMGARCRGAHDEL
eukprot:TRINITY_DN791_c0_g1_i1.p2 TRINITY_DN791_c0_g1~~TRINITY_DN791_c0_g1_i1.p2  ORF type:complete len:399 (+),score=143.18 TRINITY_DN791_c0_g1_i1:67-1263(+)